MVTVAEANDPKQLRVEIAKLKAELAKKNKDHVVLSAPARTVETIVKVPVLTDREREKLRLMLANLQAVSRLYTDFDKAMMASARTLPEANRVLDKLDVFAKETTVSTAAGAVTIGYEKPIAAAIRETAHRQTMRTVKGDAPSTESDTDKPSGGSLRILLVLGQRYALDQKTITRSQLATLSGFKVSGGSFRTYISFLRTRGYIEGSDDFKITMQGIEFLGELPQQPTNTDEMVAMWLEKLDGKARDMLKYLVKVYPDGISKDELATAVELDAAGGSFRTYLSKLRVNGLALSDRDGRVQASESLFL